MMIKPKRIGHELTLDEYNACQYLLYQKKCWNETLILNTAIPYVGKYATYQFNKNSILLNDENAYRINANQTVLTETNLKCTVTLKKVLSFISKLHITPTVTIYYKKPQQLTNGTGNYTYDAQNPKEINQTMEEEPKVTPSLNDYVKTTVPTTINGNIISFVLKDEDGNLLPNGSVIKNRININYMFNTEPYIDFRNGKANDMDEIWVDTVYDLHQLIEHAPTDGTLTVIRLDSNANSTKPKNALYSDVLGQYFLSKTITIQKGQNIEIRGGTNNNAIINPFISKRCFIVKPGARLSLKNITCEYGRAGDAAYDKGRGGAILVEFSNEDYGILECEYCKFHHNTAWWGGAIYAYHCGLHLNKCTFEDNVGGYSGGAVEYIAKNVKIDFQNMIVAYGSTITMFCYVYDMNGVPINEGSVIFYIRENGVDTEIGRARVRTDTTTTSKEDDGRAEINYVTPKDEQTTDHTIIAKYVGGRMTDDEVTMATLTVKVPEKFTASWVAGNVVKGKIGDTITLNAKLVDSKGVQSTVPLGQYTINNNTMMASMNGNIYQLKYKLSEKDVIDGKYEFIASFSTITSDEYSSNTITAKITIDNENASNTIEGYMTALWVNANSLTEYTTAVADNWIKAGITDVYVRFNNYTIDSSKTLIDKVVPMVKGKKIRLHVAMNCFYDAGNEKWISPSDESRMKFIKEHIDYIAKNYTVNGICLDYVRYSGVKQDSKAHTTITSKLKEINEHIKSKNKNYIISASVMPEDDGSSLYYGQNFKEMSEYVDCLHIMAYKGDYATNGKEQNDTWVYNRANYAIDSKVDKEKIIVSLQTYQSDKDLTPRTIDNLNATMKSLKKLYIKGVSLFRAGLLPTKTENNKKVETYPTSFKDIMEAK